MLQSDDHIYFSRRYDEEIENGDHAATAIIAAIHYELAHRYSLIARTNPARPALRLVVGGKNSSFTDQIDSATPHREIASS